MAEADLAVLCDGAVQAEALQADADKLCSLCGVLCTGLDGDGRAHAVRPADVFKADRRDAGDYIIGGDALGLAKLSALFDRAESVLSEDTVYFVYSSLVIFKQSH